MIRFRTFSRLQMLVTSALLIALVAVACGSDDDGVIAGGTADGKNPQRIRMIESTTVFTEDDIKAIGWKAQKDFVLDYPGATTYKWGYLNSKEVGVLIYATAEEAMTTGVEMAEAQTFRREEDGQAPDEGIDRISCRQKQGASAVKANTGVGSKAFSSSYLAPEASPSDDTSWKVCANRYPTYNDYTVIGNVVFMCEGDGRNLLEPSTNCAKFEEWLTK